MTTLTQRAGLADSHELHRWSVEHSEDFWELVWHDTGVVGERGTAPAVEDGRFFADARLSYAENLLSHAPSADAVAVIEIVEDGSRRQITWAELAEAVAATTAALRSDGVTSGDRVAAWMPNVIETVVTALGVSAVGAVFTSTSPDFGVEGVIDRFGQVDPTVLVVADGYRYGGEEFEIGRRLDDVVERLPSLRRVVLVPRLGGNHSGSCTMWDDWLSPHRGAPARYERVPFDHPGFILYSSGTTGPPKCIVHRAGGVLIKHLVEHHYHCDIRPGDRVLYFTTCGWMMWNWQLSALASGATIVCYDGSPFHPGPSALFDLAERLELTLLGVSAKFIDACRKSDGLDPARTHRFPGLRTICSTGSPLHADGFRWVHDHVKADVHLASISGGTDLCGCFVMGDPTTPVWAGEIQGAALGMDVDVFDDTATACPPGVDGELVCRPTFPSVPLGFWGDHTGDRFHAAYLERFPGWWTQGDFATWASHPDTARRGMIIHGRSDATLNAGGVRIGTAEIYRVVERLDAITECVAVGQQWDDDSRIVLFVRPAPGHVIDDDLTATIRGAIRSSCSPRHVPARIVEVSDIPRTRSGKISELAVADVVNGRSLRNVTALANPEALEQYLDRPELRS